LRPERDPAVRPFWDFFLHPELEGLEADEMERNHWRRAVFDDIAEIQTVSELDGRPLPDDLRKAMDLVARGPLRAEGDDTREKSITAAALFEKLRKQQPAHRMVLLKAAAEWIVPRYERRMQHWEKRKKQWEKEKAFFERL
jgi:gluconate kinase